MKFFISVLLLLAYLFINTSVNAAFSDHVLPYPPQMPGGYIYKLRVIGEKIQKIWSFGSFSQFSYNLKLADKYLVQAKTLFEYKQYLLGYESLKESDLFFKEAITSLDKAKIEKKDISQKKIILKSASLKHIEELNTLQMVLPEEINWIPEKTASTKLLLRNAIKNSLEIRKLIYE
ncbi:MAG: hypothetical protein AAB907_01395 [Patescibacteria group bacterium]